MTARGVDPSLTGFVGSLVYFAIMAFTFIAVLGQFGVQTASFVAILGAAGFAVGMALQGTLANFASGVMILLFRPFKAGDFIEAAGVKGKVMEIAIFSTTICTPDNVKIIVPNGTALRRHHQELQRLRHPPGGHGHGHRLRLGHRQGHEILSDLAKNDSRSWPTRPPSP